MAAAPHLHLYLPFMGLGVWSLNRFEEFVENRLLSVEREEWSSDLSRMQVVFLEHVRHSPGALFPRMDNVIPLPFQLDSAAAGNSSSCLVSLS